MPNKKVLHVHPSKLNKHVYSFARDMYEMLIKWEGVSERYSSILASIASINENNTTLIVPERLSIVDLYLLWGSPGAPYIEQIIFKCEEGFHYREEKWMAEKRLFEKLYGVKCPTELLSLFHFNRVILDAFDVEIGLFDSLSFAVRDGVETNLDPVRGAEKKALVWGKMGQLPPEYFPYAWYGSDGVSYGMYIDYYRKEVVAAYEGDGALVFQRNFWDDLLVKLNQELPFDWNRLDVSYFLIDEAEYRGAEDFSIYNRNDLYERCVALLKGGGDEYANEAWRDLALLTLQRMIVTFLKTTPVYIYSINRYDYMALYDSSWLVQWYRRVKYLGPYEIDRKERRIRRQGMYLDEGCEGQIRTLPLKYCRWQDEDKIDSIIMSIEFGYSVDISSIPDVIEQQAGTVELAVKEAEDGYPLLAYFLGFRYWCPCDRQLDAIALRLFRSSLSQLGMNALLKTIELHVESRHDRYIYA